MELGLVPNSFQFQFFFLLHVYSVKDRKNTVLEIILLKRLLAKGGSLSHWLLGSRGRGRWREWRFSRRCRLVKTTCHLAVDAHLQVMWKISLVKHSVWKRLCTLLLEEEEEEKVPMSSLAVTSLLSFKAVFSTVHGYLRLEIQPRRPGSPGIQRKSAFPPTHPPLKAPPSRAERFHTCFIPTSSLSQTPAQLWTWQIWQWSGSHFIPDLCSRGPQVALGPPHLRLTSKEKQLTPLAIYLFP